MSHLTLSFLGTFRVALDHTPQTFATDKVRALLAYLVIEQKRVHRRETLAGLLWPNQSDSMALQNLRQTLTRLRRAIGDHEADPPFLLITKKSIQFNPVSSYTLDVDQFTQAISPFLITNSQQLPTPVQQLQMALEAYQGELLAGLFLSDSQPFEEWLTLNREHLHRQFQEGLHYLAAHFQAQGNYEQAISYLQQQLALEPWHEEAHRQLMHTLAQSGQRSQALAHYQICQQQLQDELGVPPTEETTALYEQILAGEIGWQAEAGQEASPDNPYKGLHAFQEDDAMDFFGREALVQHLVEQMSNPPDIQQRSEWTTRFTAIVGPSGSGKSSLIRAGLLPALRQSQDTIWHITEMFPGTAPFAELAQALQLLSADITDQDALAAKLQQSDKHLSHLLATGWASPLSSNQRLLLLIDQFEELFTLVSNEAARHQFLAMLRQTLLAPECPWLHIIITLRADFYDQPLRYPDFGQLLHQRAEVVLPLTPQGLEQAIIGPAKRVGVTLESGLAAAIVADVSEQPGSLPLLQYALTELFERREGRHLTLAAYQSIGGVSGALTRRADEIYRSFSPEGQAVARQLFLRLVTLNEGTNDVRRRVSHDELLSVVRQPSFATETTGDVLPQRDADVIQMVLNIFSEYRLLTFDQDPTTHDSTVEVAHEALIQEWEQLREWLQQNREALQQHQRLMRLADEWQQAAKDDSYLVGGTQLSQFESWVATTDLALTPLEAGYLQASLGARDKQVETEAARQSQERLLKKRSQNRLYWLVAVLLIATIGALGLTTLALTQRNRAEAQSRLMTSRQLAAQSQNLQMQQFDLALLLSLEAYHTQDTLEAKRSLFNALLVNPQLKKYLYGHQASVNDLAFHPQQPLLASGDSAGMIFLWDTATAELKSILDNDNPAEISALAFSPTGAILAVGDNKHKITLWDVTTERVINTLNQPTNIVVKVIFSPDGRYLAAIDYDNQLRIWDVATSQIRGEYVSESDGSELIAFSPDSQTLAVADALGTIMLWDVATWQPQAEIITEHSDDLNDIAFNRAGTLLASASSDQTIKFWEMPSGKAVGRPLSDHSTPLVQIHFTADDQAIIARGVDGTLQRWEMEPGGTIPQTETRPTLTSHAQNTWASTISADGQTVATAGLDQAVILWDFSPASVLSRRLARPLLGPHPLVTAIQPINWVEFSEDGRLFALGGEAGELVLGRLADPATSTSVELYGPFSAHDSGVNGLAFSLDHKFLASGDWNGNLVLWDLSRLETPTPLTLPLVYSDEIWGIAFSPDGRTLAANSLDGTITWWDLTTTPPTLQATIKTDRDIFDVAFSPDGQTLVSSAADWTVQLWDRATAQEITPPLQGHEDFVNRTIFSPTEPYFISASSDNSLRLWSFAGERAEAPVASLPLIGHLEEVVDVAFSPDGQTIASLDIRGDIIWWEVATRQALGTIHTDPDTPAFNVTFSADGQWIITITTEGEVIAWDLRLESWQAQACTIAARNLTEAEWAHYVGAVPYRETCVSWD